MYNANILLCIRTIEEDLLSQIHKHKLNLLFVPKIRHYEEDFKTVVDYNVFCVSGKALSGMDF